MRHLAVLAACSVSALVLGLRAEPAGREQDPAFRAAVEIVDVDVSVLDRNRLPVRGLGASDFTVFEDGQARPVAAFTEVTLPSRERPSAPWMAAVAPDVLSNSFPREGRLVAILIDRSLSDVQQRAAREIAEAAVDQLRPGDLAAVVFSTLGVPQNFTSDRGRLLEAIRQPLAGTPQGGDAGETQCYCGVCTLDSVGRIAEAMQDVRQRRKMLLVIVSRISIESTGRCGGAVSGSRRRAMRALEAGNITVHVFDPTGLETLAPSASVAGGLPARGIDTHLRRRGNLQILPDHTGGRLVSDPIRPAARVTELYRESDSYYILGFQPRMTGGRARFREIEVKVNRRDVTLQARRGYYTAGAVQEDTTSLPASVPPALRGAITGLWPTTDVPVAMVASPLATPDLQAGVVAVTLHVTQDFEDQTRGGAPAGRQGAESRVRALVGAFDRNGRALAFDSQTVDVAPRRLTDHRFEYQLTMHLDLKPGRYEIRAAVEDTTMGRAGSVYGSVDVPDFRREPVSLSGVFLNVSPSLPSSSTGERAGLPRVPATARRQFAQSDTVTGFVRLYHGLTRAALPGYLVSQIRDANDQVVYRQESRLVAEHVGAGRATDITLDVPVARLAPGAYVLMVESRHGSDSASRQVRFEIH